MSQQSDMADLIYRRLSRGVVPSAEIVRELRERWGPEFGVSAVHGCVREVATCLLHRDDVEVGDIEEGRFVSWGIEPWEANTRIDEEMMSMPTFLEVDSGYVFRKKKPNQTPEAACCARDSS